MAFPETIDPTLPGDSDLALQGPSIFRALKQFIIDEFGFSPAPTQQTAAPFSITPAGVVSILQAGATVATDPTASNGIATKNYVDANKYKVLFKQTGNPIFNLQNTTTLTTILSATIPAGTLGTAGIVRITWAGKWFNNAGGIYALTFSMYYGGTLVATSGPMNPASSVNPGLLIARAHIAALGATNSQFVAMDYSRPGNNAGFAGGGYDTVTQSSGSNWVGGVDSTQAQSLTVQAQLGIASTNFSLSPYFFLIESMPS